MTEIHKFVEYITQNNIWKNGYSEGNPLNPDCIAKSYDRIKVNNSTAAFINGKSSFHEIYLRCIKPYIDNNTNALEIGAGGGAWTKCMLSAKNIYTLDILSAEYNKFWEHIQRNPNASNIRYVQVQNFNCTELPDNFFDYVFSFGTLCHVSFNGITAYAKNMYSKLTNNCDCFWMVADQHKFCKATGVTIQKRTFLWDGEYKGWYFSNIDDTCSMLQDLGYVIINRDLDLNIRDPIIHFKKQI